MPRVTRSDWPARVKAEKKRFFVLPAGAPESRGVEIAAYTKSEARAEAKRRFGFRGRLPAGSLVERRA